MILKYELLRRLISNNQAVDFNTPTTEWIFRDRTCLELFLCSGDIMNNDYKKAIDLLGDILASDCSAKYGFKLKLAVATALSFACPVPAQAIKNTFIDGFERYHTFSKWADENVFFDTFYRLNAWHLRYVIGSWHQTDELIWARENIVPSFKDPLKVAEATFKMMTYQKQNDEGVSIHKRNEYYHFLPVTLENYCKFGGVCGAISRFGVAMAQAHGIPALMVGQPGHGAFIWYKGESWSLANRVRGWDKSKTNPRIQYSWRREAPFFQLMNDAQKKFTQYVISEKIRLLSTLVEPSLSFKLLFSATHLCHENYRIWENMKGVLEKSELTYTVIHSLMAPILEEKLPTINEARNLSTDSDTTIEMCTDETKFSADSILNSSQQHWGTSDENAMFIVSVEHPIKVNQIRIQWWAVFRAVKYELWFMEETRDQEETSFKKIRTEVDETRAGGPNCWSSLNGWDQLTRKLKFVMTEGNENRKRKKFNFGIRRFEIWGEEIRLSSPIAILLTENNNCNVPVSDIVHEGAMHSKVLSLPQLTMLSSAEIVWKQECEQSSKLSIKVSNNNFTVEHPHHTVWLHKKLSNSLIITDIDRNVEAIRIHGVPYSTKTILKMRIRDIFREHEDSGCYCYLKKELIHLVNSIAFHN